MTGAALGSGVSAAGIFTGSGAFTTAAFFSFFSVFGGGVFSGGLGNGFAGGFACVFAGGLGNGFAGVLDGVLAAGLACGFAIGFAFGFATTLVFAGVFFATGFCAFEGVPFNLTSTFFFGNGFAICFFTVCVVFFFMFA